MTLAVFVAACSPPPAGTPAGQTIACVNASAAHHAYVVVQHLSGAGSQRCVGFDGATIDGLGPDGLAARANDIAGVLSRFQSGYLYHYAFVMLVGVAALVSYFMLFVR